METMNFKKVAHDLTRIRAKLVDDKIFSSDVKKQFVSYTLDELYNYKPNIQWLMQAYGIYSYSPKNSQSLQNLEQIMPKAVIKNSPRLRNSSRIYYYINKKKMKMDVLNLKNMIAVLNHMIVQCHKIPQDQRRDFKEVMAQEKAVKARENSKKQKKVEKPVTKGDKSFKPVSAPFPSAQGYHYNEVIEWHEDETGDNFNKGYLVIADYRPQADKPYLVPNVYDYNPTTHQLTSNKHIWMTGKEIAKLQHAWQDHYATLSTSGLDNHMDYQNTFDNYTTSLDKAVHFLVNPYWQIIDVATNKQSVDEQLKNYRFCMMLNQVGNGQKQSQGA